MKNVSLALNAVLIIAVGILYYLHFKQPVETNTISEAPKTVATPVASTIVYVNTDSLLEPDKSLTPRGARGGRGARGAPLHLIGHPPVGTFQVPVTQSPISLLTQAVVISWMHPLIWIQPMGYPTFP